jgi:hypothetical protein
MTYVAIVLVMLVAFALVGWPLVGPARDSRRAPSGASAGSDLVDRRDAAYRAIKDLEFEYELGNLSESDYRSLRERYRSEAAAILRELDAVQGEAAAEAAPSGPAGQAAVVSTATARVNLSCPSCGRRAEEGDRYCSSCGSRLEAEA